MPHHLLRPRGQPHDREMFTYSPRRLPRQALAYTTHRDYPRLRAGREPRLDLRAHRIADGGAHGRGGGVRALGEELHAAAVTGIERVAVAEDVLRVVLPVEALPITRRGSAIASPTGTRTAQALDAHFVYPHAVLIRLLQNMGDLW